MKSKHGSSPNLLLVVIWVSSSLPETETAGADLRGAGASFPNDVYQTWIPAYRAYRQPYIDLNMTYDPVGSDQGKAMIVEDAGKVEYVGSDSLLTDSERHGKSDLITFPTMAGGAVLAYNLPGCDVTVNLTRDHAVGIYNGTYRVWNESTLQEENQWCQLPGNSILVLARKDSSGTTRLFTEVLSSFSPQWQQHYGVFSSGVDDASRSGSRWNSSVIYLYGKGNNGMSGLVMSLPYSIGYMAVSAAQSARLTYARLQNKHQQFLLPTSEAIQMAMDSRADNLTASLADGKLQGAYPLASYTFFIIYRTQMTDCSSAKELVRYVDWFLKTDSARRDCEKLLMVPLSPTIRDRVHREVLEKVTCRGRQVWQDVLADMAREGEEEETWVLVVAVSVSLLSVILGVTGAYVAWHRYKLLRMIDSDDWNIPIEDIVFFEDRRKISGTATSRITSAMLEKSFLSLGEIADGVEILAQVLQWPGKWRGNTVGVRMLEVRELKQVTRNLKRTMLWMRDNLQHANLVRFYGLTEVESDRYVIGEYCAKGAMMDILRNDKYNFNNDFKFSLAADIASGMAFLHANSLVHGALTSASCLLDARWTIKVVDWELCRLLTTLQPKRSPLLSLMQSHIGEEERCSSAAAAAAFRRFWVAPEVLRADFMLPPSSSADVYSFGIILQEIYTREDPYVEVADTLTPQQVVRAVCSNHLRPWPTEDIPIPVRQVMEIAWSDNPAMRPTFEQMVKMLRQSRSSRTTVLDSMMETMEEYTYHLEQQVDQCSAEVTLTKQNLQSLLVGSVPPHLVPLLVNGETTRVETNVQGRVYTHLGVVMMEVVGVGAAVLHCRPRNVLEVLNDLCAAVDGVVKRYGAYRSGSHEETQTILVGLESEITVLDQRCATVANLVFDLLDCVTNMAPVTSGSRATALSMCAGVNVGKVVTGLVGGATPRFVQLGEGVEEAKALMTCSTAGKVRASRNVFSHLEKNLAFVMEEAGWIVCVGMEVESFWISRPARKMISSVPSDHSADSGIEVEKAPVVDSVLGDTDKRSETSDVSQDTAVASEHPPQSHDEMGSDLSQTSPLMTKQQDGAGSQLRQRQLGQILSDITEEDEVQTFPLFLRQQHLHCQESVNQSPLHLQNLAQKKEQAATLQKRDEVHVYAVPKVHLVNNNTNLPPQETHVTTDGSDVISTGPSQPYPQTCPTGASCPTDSVMADSVDGQSVVDTEQSPRDMSVSRHSNGYLDYTVQLSEHIEVVSVSSADKIQRCLEIHPNQPVLRASGITNSDSFKLREAQTTLQTDLQSHKHTSTTSFELSDAHISKNSSTGGDDKLITTQCSELMTNRRFKHDNPYCPKDKAHTPLRIDTDFPHQTVLIEVQEQTPDASSPSQESHTPNHTAMSQRFQLLYPRQCKLISPSFSPDLHVTSQDVSVQMENISAHSEPKTVSLSVSHDKCTSFMPVTDLGTLRSSGDPKLDQLDPPLDGFYQSDKATHAEASESQSEQVNSTESLSSEERSVISIQKSPKKTKVKKVKKPPGGEQLFLLHHSKRRLRQSSPAASTRGKSKPANKVFPSC